MLYLANIPAENMGKILWPSGIILGVLLTKVIFVEGKLVFELYHLFKLDFLSASVWLTFKEPIVEKQTPPPPTTTSTTRLLHYCFSITMDMNF